MRLLLLISFSNFSSVFKTLFDENNNIESNIFAVLKLFIIKKTDEFSINFSQLSDN